MDAEARASADDARSSKILLVMEYVEGGPVVSDQQGRSTSTCLKPLPASSSGMPSRYVLAHDSHLI